MGNRTDMGDTMKIKVDFREKHYEIPAAKVSDGEGERYIILHKPLVQFFLDAAHDHPDIRMQKKALDTSINHCVSQVAITSNERPNEFWFTGEACARSLSEIGRENPYIMAENRAMDKAILDFFGLMSKAYTEDEGPLLYSGVPRQEQGPAAAQAGPAPLTQEERDELKVLSESEITVRGARVAIGSLPESSAEAIASMELKEGQEALEGMQAMVRRYLALKARGAADGAAA